MIEALTRSLGIVTSACQSVGIDRVTHYNWCKADEKYNKAVDDIFEVTLDVVEGKLHDLIKEGNPNAIFYYLNNKGKSRGYSRIQVEQSDDSEKPQIIKATPPKDLKLPE